MCRTVAKPGTVLISSSYVIRGLDQVDKFLIHFLSLSGLIPVKVSKTGEIPLKKVFL